MIDFEHLSSDTGEPPRYEARSAHCTTGLLNHNVHISVKPHYPHRAMGGGFFLSFAPEF